VLADTSRATSFDVPPCDPLPPPLETQEEIASYLRTSFSALFSLNIPLQDDDLQRITDHTVGSKIGPEGYFG